MHPETGASLKLGNRISRKYSLSYCAFVSIIQYKNIVEMAE